MEATIYAYTLGVQATANTSVLLFQATATGVGVENAAREASARARAHIQDYTTAIA